MVSITVQLLDFKRDNCLVFYSQKGPNCQKFTLHKTHNLSRKNVELNLNKSDSTGLTMSKIARTRRRLWKMRWTLCRQNVHSDTPFPTTPITPTIRISRPSVTHWNARISTVHQIYIPKCLKHVLQLAAICSSLPRYSSYQCTSCRERLLAHTLTA